MKRDHRMVPGYDFMPMSWCGGCETCDRMYCADVCLKCSYTRKGYPKGYPTTYCTNNVAARPRPLINKGGRPRA